MSKGGGGSCECPRVGVFVFFGGADDITRTMSKGGGGACECLDPPPPSGNPVSAPVHSHNYVLVVSIRFCNCRPVYI